MHLHRFPHSPQLVGQLGPKPRKPDPVLGHFSMKVRLPKTQDYDNERPNTANNYREAQYALQTSGVQIVVFVPGVTELRAEV